MDELSDYAEKAVVINNYGDYSVLKVERRKLAPLENLVEVKVHYCGLNFADIYTRKGLMPNDLPLVLGMECCGEVTKLGFETDEFKVGDKLICYSYKCGMFSNIIRVPAKYCFKIPDWLSYEVGSAIFVNYLTAYFSVLEMGNLRPNEAIFIQSCGGGVGWAATQLAKTIKNTIIYGTTSNSKIELVKSNGVDHIFSHDNLEAQLKEHCSNGIDLLLDTESGQTKILLEKYLNPLGRTVLLGCSYIIQGEKKLSAFSLLKLWWNSKTISPLTLVTSNRVVGGLHLGILAEMERKKISNALNYMFHLLKDGKINPKIDSIWKIEEIVEATKVLAERKNVGKVLLKVI